MPENPTLPKPNQILGTRKALPKPDDIFNAPEKSEVFDVFQQYDKSPTGIEKANQIIDNIPEMNGDDESKKGILKDLVKRGANKEQISNSLLTLQGKHPHQEGGQKYYVNDNGEVIPLKNSERPPAGYDVGSLFGSQKDAENDNLITSTAKHLWNGVVGAAEGVVSLGESINGLFSGNESEIASTLKNSAEYLKFHTKSSEKESVFDTKNMESWTDIFDPSRYDFSGDKVQGQILNGLESVVSFAVGRGTGQVKNISNLGQKALSAVSAYNMSLTQMLDAADEAGLQGRDKYAFATAASIPQAALESMAGVGGLLTKNAAAKAEITNIAKVAARNMERDAAGNLTKEGLEKLNKEMTIASTAVAKKFGAQTLGTIAEETATETTQQFAEEASKQLYDKLSEDPKFNADAFSPASFGKYINSAIGGALGSVGPSAALVNQNRKIAKDKAQKESVFDVVTKGDDAIKAFKTNIQTEVKRGGLTPQEADDAIIKVNSYKEYNDIVTSQGLNLDDTQKKEAFDKTFQKENLEGRIRTMGDPKKLNPLQQGEYHALEKQANDLQKDISAIVLKAQVKQETTVGDKTVNDIAKSDKKVKKEGEKENKLSPELQALIDKHKAAPESKAKQFVEKRSYEQIPVKEFNHPGVNARMVHSKVVEHLEKQPDQRIFGELKEVPFTYGNKKGSTFTVQLPDGKRIRLASSMERPEKFRGHMRTEHLAGEKELHGFPVGLKLETLSDGRKAIKIYNAKSGKFISWAKETNTGKEKISEKQADEFDHLATIIEPTEGTETVGKNKIVPPSGEGTQLNLGQNVQKNIPTLNEFIANRINEVKTEGQYHPDLEKTGTYERIFTNQYNKQYGKIKESHTVGETQHRPESTEKPVTEIPAKNKRLKGRTGATKKVNRKIKAKNKIDALSHEVFNPYDITLQYFIRGGEVSVESIRKLYKGSKSEVSRRIGYIRNTAPTVEQIAENLLNSNENLKFELSDYVTAIEEAIQNFTSSSQMADDLNTRYNENVQYALNEEVVNQVIADADESGVEHEMADVVEEFEQLPDEDLIRLDENDNELTQFILDVNEIKPESTEDIIAKKEGEEDVFQKESINTKENIDKVVKHIQKVLPNILVKYNPNLKAAGSFSGKTIEINPYYAGKDTPIHEAAHVLLDTIGHDNKVVQQAIQQLKNTTLWNETKKRYPELSEQGLENEVLAEAIGREGAGIFNKVADQNKFMQYLNYIFDWFKRKLGLERNAVKSLAKQIISGIGTKELGKENIKPVSAKSKKVITGFDEVNAKKGINRKESLKEFNKKFINLADKAKSITDNFKDIVNQLKQSKNLIEKC